MFAWPFRMKILWISSKKVGLEFAWGTWKIREIELLWWLPSLVPDWYYCHATCKGERLSSFWSWFLLKLVIALLLLQPTTQNWKDRGRSEGERNRLLFMKRYWLDGRPTTSNSFILRENCSSSCGIPQVHIYWSVMRTLEIFVGVVRTLRTWSVGLCAGLVRGIDCV